jgi:hypothetical protein
MDVEVMTSFQTPGNLAAFSTILNNSTWMWFRAFRGRSRRHTSASLLVRCHRYELWVMTDGRPCVVRSLSQRFRRRSAKQVTLHGTCTRTRPYIDLTATIQRQEMLLEDIRGRYCLGEVWCRVLAQMFFDDVSWICNMHRQEYTKYSFVHRYGKLYVNPSIR